MKKTVTLLCTILLLSTLLFTGCVSDDESTENNQQNQWGTPTADFTASPTPIIINETVFFNSTSLKADGLISNWTWKFDDETTLYGPKIIHRFNQSGVYNVSLTITDTKRQTDSIVRTIVVYKKPLLEKLSLQQQDLPEGYIRYLDSYNSTLGFNFTVPVEEVYNEQFIYQDQANKTGFPLIVTTLCRFNSTNNAQLALLESAERMNTTFTELLTLVSSSIPDQVGDQSIYHLFQGKMSGEYNYQNQTVSWSYLYFRFENITVFVLLNEIPPSDIDYPTVTYHYATLIEENIIDYYKD